MIRQFDIRDVSVVQRLSPLGQALAYEPVAVEGISPLPEALRSYAAGGIDNRLVMVRRVREPEVEAFGMLQMMSDDAGESPSPRRFGALLYIAPTPHDEAVAAAWIDLVQAMVSQAAERGAVHVIAEAPAEGYELGALQIAGFSPLVHQDIMKLARIPEELEPVEVNGLREQRDADDPLLKLLAMRTVPKPIQKAGSSTDLTRSMRRVDCGFVLFEQGELVGHVAFRRGRRGYGMHTMFLHAAESLAEGMLTHALSRLCGRSHKRPVYCTIPSYQSWMLPPLDRLGFSHVTSNVLMIRHTAATVQQPVWSIDAKTVPGRVARSRPNVHHSRVLPRAGRRPKPDKRGAKLPL